MFAKDTTRFPALKTPTRHQHRIPLGNRRRGREAGRPER